MKSKKSATVTPSNGISSHDRHWPYVVSPKGEFSLQKVAFTHHLMTNLALEKMDIEIPRASGLDLS